MDRLTAVLLRTRFAIWLVVLFGAGALAWFARPVEFDQSVEGFFPPDYPALASYERAKQTFGSDDLVFVAYADDGLWTDAGMARVRRLADELARVTGVVRVEAIDRMPLPWRVDAAARALVEQPLAIGKLLGGLTTVGSAVLARSGDDQAIALLRERLCSHTLFRNTLVDADGRVTSLVVQLDSPERIDFKEVIAGLRAVANAFAAEHGFERIAVVGPPVLVADGFISIEKDNRTLGVVAMALMALTMLVAVRSPWWAVLPLACGWSTWLVTQQLLNAFDLRLTLSAGPIIAQTVVLCMPAASHLAMHFRESLGESDDPREGARRTLVAVASPIAWCSLTAAAGYLALLSSTVKPVYQFGATMAVCNLAAGLLAYLLAAGAMLPPEWLGRRTIHLAARASTSRRVAGLTAWAIEHPGRVIALFVVPSLLLAAGMMRLRFESNYINIYKAGTPVARDYRFVEDRFGGIGLVELVFRGPEKVTVDWVNSLDGAAAKLSAAAPDVVTQVLSIANVLREESAAQPGGDDGDANRAAESGAEPAPRALPFRLGGQNARHEVTAERVLETKLRVLNTPAYSHFLKNFWDKPSGMMRVLVRIREGAEADRKQAAFRELLAVARAELPAAAVESIDITGLSHLMTQVTTAIITTQFQSTAWSGALILLMLALALRGVRLALLALVPTLLAVGLVLGAMGWFGIKIDMSTALVASVAMGLSVDDTFHCLLRWKREVGAGCAPSDALRAAYAGAGPGVVVSSAAVSLGFLAMIFSEFVPTANFGWLVAVATLGGSAGNLIVLPACLALAHRTRAAAKI